MNLKKKRISRLVLIAIGCLLVLGATLTLKQTIFANPGRATHLVISEVQTAGGTATDEFIELYNPTDSAVDISTWSIQYRGGAATTYYKNNLPGSVPAHGFFLITNSTAAPDGYDGTVTADTSGTTISLSATGGTVFLVNDTIALTELTDSGSTVVDKVAYGTGTAGYLRPEGTEYTPAPTANNSIERKAISTSTATTMASGNIDQTKGNGEDTNGNSADFISRTTSDPQNSSSTSREDPVTKLSYKTAEQTFAVNVASGPFSVWSLDEGSISCPLYTGAATINLSSDSSSERFDTSAGGPFDGTITSITIASGVYEGVFYYKEPTTAGIYSILSEEVSPGPYSRYWTPDPKQTVTITSANTAPFGGYSADNVIPAAQCVQSTNGDAVITISFRIKDAETNSCTLKTFQYSIDGGIGWSAPTNGDASACLSGFGATFTSATGWTGTVHSFTWDADHADVTGISGTDQSDIRIRFTVNDSALDSVSPATSENFSVDDLNPAALVTADLTAQPNAGDTTVTIDCSFTETNPNISTYYVAINGGAYGSGTQATGTTADPPATATAVGATLDGDDYISKVKCVHVDDYGNSGTNENLSPSATYKYVIPRTPLAPTVDNPTVSTIDVTVNPNASEVTTVKYAIHETSTGNYVQAPNISGNATLGVSAVWQVIGTSAGQWGYGKTSGKVTVTGLSENTQYTFEVKATNPNDAGTTVSAYGTSASKYTLLDPPTDGELTVSPHATDPTIMGTISVATPPNSTAGSTSSYFTVVTGSTLGAGDHGWTNGQYSYSDTGLNANTQYGWKVKYHNGDGTATTETSEKTAYTLAKAPSEAASTTTIQQITCARSKSTWYGSADGATFTFSTTDGFGVGKVQYFKYVWDTNASTDPSSGTNWSTGTLPLTATSDSNSWYLHLKSYNADNVGHPTLLHFGPFYYDGTAPTSVTISGVSESADNLHYTGGTLYYSNDQVMTDAFTVTVTASDATSGLKKCVGENGFGEVAPDDTSPPSPFEITYTVNQTESETSPLTMTVYDNANNTATVDLTIALDNDAPAQISGLSAPSSTASSVSLSWNALSSAGTSGYSTYEIWYSTNATVGTSDNLWDETNEAALSLYTTISATVTGLSASTTYYFNIDGLDNVKNRGALGASEVEKATTSGATKDIKINEFMMQKTGAPIEWVELYNSGTTAHDLNGWQLRDKTLPLHNFNSSLVMNPGDYLVIYSGDWTGTDDTNMNDGKGEIKGNDWDSTGDLVNTGDAIQLYNSQTTFDATTIADFVWYDALETDDPGTVDDNAVAAGIWPPASVSYRSLDGLDAPTDRPAWLYCDGYTPNETTRPALDWNASAATGTDTPGGPNRPPTIITAIAFKNAAFDTDVTTANLGDNLYIKLTGTDAEASYSNTCLIKLDKSSVTGEVRITLTETGVNTGIYQSLTGTGAASVNSAVSYATDTVGAAAGDTVRATWHTDTQTSPISPYDDITISGGVTKITITNWRELY